VTMADNVAITAGSGTTIGTDERSINSTNVQVQRVVDQGSSNIANGHVAVTNTATTIIAARDTRKRAVIVNYQTVSIYIGVSTVTTSNGFRLDPGASITLYTTVLIQGITAAAYTAAGEDDKTHYVEEYDS